MIYTITFNPALDYISQVENFQKGKINRTTNEKILPGGKGLNVSIVLKNLEIDNTALGFIAGFTGDELKRRIEQYNVKTNFIKVEKGITRINVKISSNEETALNGCGPQISEVDLEKILKQIDEIQKEDIVILAGNIPKNINKNIYEKICLKLKEKETTFIVDATRELLIGILKYNPFLIKPNKEELEETFGVKIQGEQEIIQYAKKLQEMGARNVLISLGGEGAILITEENKIYKANAPKGKVISTVGSGDSMVAGFIAGYIKNKDYKEALKLGIAAGSASAFSTELATKEKVEKLLK